EWVHVQLHQQKGMISLSPPTICNSALLRHRGINHFRLTQLKARSCEHPLNKGNNTHHKGSAYLARQQKISFRTVKQPLFLHALLAIIEILVHQARSPIYARSALYVAYTKIDSKDLPLQPVKLIRPFQSSKTSNIPKSFFIHFYCWA
ncbi:hypothetical protein, partial [Enterobacter hormaechei]|uniref:hypothetical protein n=1 Tax=Enterobacter hormaechei TaxID=158836 RepID=UPI001C401082